MEFPQHCERGVIDKSTLASSVTKDEVAAIKSRRVKANGGLTMFEHNPAGMNRMELFDHQIAFRQRSFATREKDHKITDHLNCSPRTTHQGWLMGVEYHNKIKVV